MAAAVFRTIFAQPDPATVAATWDTVRDQLAAPFPKIGPLMDDAKAEVRAFTAFPRSHWPKVWSTNPLERVNKEIKRRARVVDMFPNKAAVTRLVSASAAACNPHLKNAFCGDGQGLGQAQSSQPERTFACMGAARSWPG